MRIRKGDSRVSRRISTSETVGRIVGVREGRFGTMRGRIYKNVGPRALRGMVLLGRMDEVCLRGAVH